MPLLKTGRFSVRAAQTQDDLRKAQRLRYLAFVGAEDEGRDCDPFDDACTHILIEEVSTGRLVCCFRLYLMSTGAEIRHSYSSQHYDLTRLKDFGGTLLEMGRFCVLPGGSDPDILRLAWGAVTRYVDEKKVEILFGCTSFKGTDPSRYGDAFTLLVDRFLAPDHWMPRIRASAVFDFAQMLRHQKPDVHKAMSLMPPLLRTYLLMGGRVSDHAVVDRQLNTLHVFTGLETRAIPTARKRLLRAIAHSLDDTPVAG